MGREATTEELMLDSLQKRVKTSTNLALTMGLTLLAVGVVFIGIIVIVEWFIK